MMREVNDKGLARINGAQIGVGKKLADHPNWMSPEQVRLLSLFHVRRRRADHDLSFEQLNKIGFDCFPIDYLDGPDAVLAWFADAHNLNKIVRRFCSSLLRR